MVKRYISASERARVLAQGLVRYANWMDSNQQSGNIHHEYWEDWIKIWGDQMAQRVIEIHNQNFTWATNYKD